MVINPQMLAQALMQRQQERPGEFMPDPRLLGRQDLFRGDLDTQMYQPQAVPPAQLNDPGMQHDPNDVATHQFWKAQGIPRSY